MKFVYITLIAMLFAACSTAPYVTELGEIGSDRVAEKYGEGKYYFFRSKYVIAKYGDEEAEREFFNHASKHLRKLLLDYERCNTVEETLSYYSESGTVSVLVKCDGN